MFGILHYICVCMKVCEQILQGIHNYDKKIWGIVKFFFMTCNFADM